MKIDKFSIVKVKSIPINQEEGKLYISKKYKIATHLCPCGCGYKVVTPFNKGEWTLRIFLFRATLFPSIGNWLYPCKSHYWIRRNKVIWIGPVKTEHKGISNHYDI